MKLGAKKVKTIDSVLMAIQLELKIIKQHKFSLFRYCIQEQAKSRTGGTGCH